MNPIAQGTPMNITTLLVPTYTHMLKALSGWLAKAQVSSPADEAALLTARLAPDMFPLGTQIRFACVQAQEAVCRLTGAPFPPAITELLDEGRGAGEHPGTLADAQARIAQTVALLDALGPDALDVRADAPVEHALPMGIIFDFTVDQYARDWTLAQFYFHLMAAYAILRHRGVEIGKADYIPHLFANIRPGTMPGV